MTELHFKTTLLPSLPWKGKINSTCCSDKESKTLQLASFFLCSPLPFPARLKGLSSSTNVKLPNTYFLPCNHIAKTRSIVYKHITIPLRKENKKIKNLSNICKCVCRGVRWQLPDLERCHQTDNIEIFWKVLQRA